MKVENLTVEYQKSSLGLDKHAPRISWKLQDKVRIRYRLEEISNLRI